MKKKIISTALAVLMVSTALTGCGGSGGNTSGSTEASQSASAAAGTTDDGGVHLVYGIENSWSSLQIWNGPTTYSCMLEECLFEPLAEPGPEKLEYRNASSIDVSEDGKVWTCHLDDRVTWSDGEPTTAYDWEWTFQTITDPSFGIYPTSYVTCVLTGTDDSGVRIEGEEFGVKAIDDYTLELSFKEQTGLDGFFSWYGYYYRALPKHLLEDVAVADIPTCDFWKNPVGNGCLLFVEEPVTGQEITFRAREGFYLGDCDFDTVTYRVMSSENSSSALINGDVDVFFAITDWDVLMSLSANENVQVTQFETGDIFEMSINNEKFNPNVRRALSMLIDRETLINACTAGYGIPKTDSVMTAGANNNYDVEAAKAILDAEGWDYDYTISIACGEPRESQATIIQQNWAAAGVKSEIRTGETASIFNDAINGDVDCCLMANTLSYFATVDESILDPRAATYSRIQDSKYYDLCLAIDFETDEARKQELTDEFTELLRNEAPMIYIYSTPNMMATSNRLSNVKFGNLDNPWEWVVNK